MKESALHRSIREAAYKEHGHINLSDKSGMLKIYKMSTLGHMGEGGWPDMAIFIRGGHVMFIELKNPDGTGECTDLQLQRHAELRALGFNVHVCNDRGAALALIRREVIDARKGHRVKR